MIGAVVAVVAGVLLWMMPDDAKVVIAVTIALYLISLVL